MLRERIGFIGAGQMATALGQGVVKSGLTKSEQIIAADPSAEARERFAFTVGGKTTENNTQVVDDADVIILAVKPQQMARVLEEVRGKLGPDRLVVSIAAGIRLDMLSAYLEDEVRLVRVMPNTPCLVGQGASAFCLGGSATQADAELVRGVLESVGVAFQVEETLLDAVTGLSGSGPAFVYMMIEALSDGGVRMGLPRNMATTLAAATLRGAAEMVLATGEHPAALKDKVTSPGGTTIAGIEALERGGLRAALMGAVQSATGRSIELGAR